MYQENETNISDMAQSVTVSEIKEVLISPDEKVLATYGNSYFQSIVSNNKADQFAFVLSDKRIYYKGTGYLKDGRFAKKAISEYVINLEDITCTGFVNIGSLNMVLVIIGCILILAFGIGLIILAFTLLSYYLTRGT